LASPIHIALFPIPELVAFPGTVVPLHVFEPRYRKMVQDCVREERMIGVCHTRKTIRPARKDQSMEEALNSNQATYLPEQVFSAGYARVKDTSPDGRILATIEMRERFVSTEVIQSLPYSIVHAEPYLDEPVEVESSSTDTLQMFVNAKLIAMLGAQSPELLKLLEDPEWIALDAAQFSYRIFQYIRFDADFMQSVLEARSAHDRLTLLWQCLGGN
jgi:Lon protease-like protein